MKKALFIFSILLIVSIMACSPLADKSQETKKNTEALKPDINQIYPIQKTLEITLSYPIEKSTFTSPMKIEGNESVFESPVKEPNFASVFGIVKSITTDKVVGDALLYIANIVPLEPNGGVVYTIQQNSSPHTYTNGEGIFVIGKIPPGKYTMIVYSPLGEIHVQNLGREPLYLELKDGDVLDLKTVYVNWP